MKAVVYTEYGNPDVLELKEISKPIPAENEILIRVHAASVNALDWHAIRGNPVIARIVTGWSNPKNTRLGADLAGQVEAVGRDVTEFQPGDEVYGRAHGTFAEYVCTQGKAIAAKPANLTFEQAAAVPVAAITALQGLRDKGRLQPRQKVLINSGSGSVGTFAVQIARALGGEVTAVCSTGKVEMVRSLGAERVIDYTRENFTRSGERYDLIFDSVGNHSPFACRRVLSPGGTYVLAGASLTYVLLVLLLSRLGSKWPVFYIARSNKEDLLAMNQLIEAGKVTPVIERRYPLSETPDAMRYFGEGHTRGKIVIKVV